MLRTVGEESSWLERYGPAGAVLGALAIGAAGIVAPNLTVHQDQAGSQQHEERQLSPLHRIKAAVSDTYQGVQDVAEHFDVMIRGTARKDTDHSLIADLAKRALSSVARQTLGMDLSHNDQRADPDRVWMQGIQKKQH
jgi:hypothetical protein